MVGVFRKDHLNHICCYDSILHKRIRQSSCLVQTTAQQTYRERGSLHLHLWWVLWSWCPDLGSDIPAWSHQLKVCRHFFSWTAAVIQTKSNDTLKKFTDAQMKGCRRQWWSEQRCSLNIVKKSRLKMETEKNQDQSKERNTNQSKKQKLSKISVDQTHRHRVSKKPHGHNSLMGTWAPVAECS